MLLRAYMTSAATNLLPINFPLRMPTQFAPLPTHCSSCPPLANPHLLFLFVYYAPFVWSHPSHFFSFSNVKSILTPCIELFIYITLFSIIKCITFKSKFSLFNSSSALRLLSNDSFALFDVSSCRWSVEISSYALRVAPLAAFRSTFSNSISLWSLDSSICFASSLDACIENCKHLEYSAKFMKH